MGNIRKSFYKQTMENNGDMPAARRVLDAVIVVLVTLAAAVVVFFVVAMTVNFLMNRPVVENVPFLDTPTGWL